MLESSSLLRRNLGTELSILSLLKVSEEVLLSLAALVVTILLRMHGEFEEFLIVLTIIPTILVHLLAEVVESRFKQRVRIDIRELTALLLGKFLQFRSDLTWHLTTLTEDHTPHIVVHHHETALALLHGEEVHQSDVLCILRERSHEWWITDTRPYISHLVEELDEQIVH